MEKRMKLTSFITAISGSMLGALQGLDWLTDLGSPTGRMALALADHSGKIGIELLKFQSATFALLICALLGLVFSFLVLMKKGYKSFNSAVLILAGLAPIIFSPKALLGVPMAVGGIIGARLNYKL